jgi:hypothetical protein
MNTKNYLTMAAGIAGVIVPQVLPMVPAPYAAMASALVALFSQLYHLYQPAPVAK